MKDLKVAIVCMQSEFGRIEKNLKRMESFVQEAAAEGVSMICFPELSTTGYAEIHAQFPIRYSLHLCHVGQRWRGKGGNVC